MLLAVLCSSAMIYCLDSLFQTSSSFGTASTVIGTLIGFLTGIYVPIGSMPEAVQAVIKIFPPTHAAVLLRQIMMDVPLREVFAGAPPEAVSAFRQQLGVELTFFGRTASPGFSLLFLIITTLVFFGLALVIAKRKKT
jgi:multidrug/hemolysin transport system permease protein